MNKKYMHDDYTQQFAVTVCSVYHSSAAKWLLELNYDIVHKLNSGIKIHWIVADNTAEDFTDKIDGNKFTVVRGADGVRPVADWIKGSYRYADAINKTLPHITTRFVILLDPDVYVVRNHWIQDVIRHMQEKKLSFFGIPYVPLHFVQMRYFPNHRALCIDLERAFVSHLDFTPRFDSVTHPTWRTRCMEKIRNAAYAISRRTTIGMRPEVGTRNYLRFRHRAEYECAQPVFVPSVDLAQIHEAFSLWEKIMPDRFSYIPKKFGYFTERGFAGAGLPDIRALGWEEFMWKSEPFAFHIRVGTEKMREPEHRQQLQNILTKLHLL